MLSSGHRFVFREIRDDYYNTVVIGNGPASIGIPLEAMGDNERYSKLQEKGFLIVGKNPEENDPEISDEMMEELGGGNIGYNINSNSPGKDFLDHLPSQILARIQDEAVVQKIRDEYNDQILPLTLVYELENLIGNALIAEYSEKLYISEWVQEIHENQDGDFVLKDKDGQDISIAAQIVFANGAHQEFLSELSDHEYKTTLSDEFLKENNNAVSQYIESVEGNPKIITIVGGAHSAFSAADNLLKNCPQDCDLQINIIHSNPVKVFYESAEAANEVGYEFNSDIDIDEGKVNRFNGIRGDAKALYENFMSRDESRISLIQSPENREEIYQDSGKIIQATGYVANKIPLYDSSGEEVQIPNRVTLENNMDAQVNGFEGKIFRNGLSVRPKDGVNVFQVENSAKVNSVILAD